MRERTLTAFLVLASPAAIVIPGAAYSATLESTYSACTDTIRKSLAPTTTRDQISFDARAEENWGRGEEFYFSWRSGFIRGATRLTPDALTGKMLPSASCIGSLSKREISSISVNGEDVISKPIGF